MFHAVATLSVLLIAAGWVCRHRLRVHVSLMLSACLLDFASVAVLELTRHAVESALRTESPLLRFHVAVSVAALLCYPALVVLGRGAVGSRPSWLPFHRWTGRVFLVLRFANYVTSWMV